MRGGNENETYWTWTAFAAAAVLFSLAISLWIQLPDLKIKNSFHGDMRQEIYWIYRLTEPDLFPDDFLAHHSESMAPALLVAVYKIGTLLFDPLVFAKSLSLFLCPLFALCFFLLLRNLKLSPAVSFVGTAICVLALWSKGTTSFGVGDAEDFAPLLFAAFAMFWTGNRPFATGVTIVIAALLYPPIWLICLGALGIDLVFSILRKKARITDKSTLIPVGAAGISICIIAGGLLLSGDYDPGTLYNRKAILTMPEFNDWGRTQFFFQSLWCKIANIRTGLSLDLGTMVLIFFSGIFLLTAPKKYLKKLDKRIWILSAISLFLFFAAHLLLMKLFSPSRYLRLPLPIILSILLANGLEYRISHLKIIRLRIPIILGVFIVAIGLWGGLASNHYTKHDFKPIFKALIELPKDARIAAFPTFADNIPILTRRSVYVSDEMNLPFFFKFHAEIKRRIQSFLNVYYSSDASVIGQFCQSEKITHLLVDKQNFLPLTTRPLGPEPQFGKGKDGVNGCALKRMNASLRCERNPNANYYFEPFGSFIRERIESPQRNFAILDLSIFKVIYQDEQFILYDCNGTL